MHLQVSHCAFFCVNCDGLSCHDVHPLCSDYFTDGLEPECAYGISAGVALCRFLCGLCQPIISLRESISCHLLLLPHGPECACGHVQVLHCADFYAGCGGLSFLDQQTPEVHITTAWAVDFCESMTLSFRANYPDAHVSHCCSCCMCLSSWHCACCLGYTDNAVVSWTAYVF